MSVVHYSHHVCAPDRTLQLDTWVAYVKRFPDEQAPADHCGRSRYVAKPRVTWDRSKVTCKHCLAGIARWNMLPRVACTDELIALRVWEACCFYRGCAPPVDRARVARKMAARELADALDLEHVLRGAVSDPANALAQLHAGVERVARLGGEAASLEMRPAIDEMTMALDLMTEVSAMLTRAQAVRARVVERFKERAA